MGMRQLKKWGLVAMVVLAVTAIAPVWAAESDDQQQQLQQIQDQIRAQQGRVSESQSKVNSISEQLRAIQDTLDVAEGQYNDVRARRLYTEQQIAANTVILAKAEADLADRTTILNKRIRDIYKNGQISYLDVLLGATDFRDFVTRVDVLQRVLQQDVSLITKVRAEKALIAQKTAELERDRALVLELESAAAEKKSLVEQQRNVRAGFLNTAVSNRDSAEQAYQELIETSRKIERMIRGKQGGNQGGLGATGSLIWPAEGPITSPFGWRTHPIFGSQSFHTGIDIGADYGDSVRAADNGTVIYADWMGGYGKAVIIDHGNGITTLYAHNSELLVSEGQHVQKGQTISRVGTTGYSTGPHLHFEVRENGSPVNPMGYLP